MPEYKPNKKERAIMQGWPRVTEQDIEAINALFPVYVFFEKKKDAVTLWSTCCRKKDTINYVVRTETPEHRELLQSLTHNASGRCPFCGKSATMRAKNLGHKCVTAYDEVLLFHADSEALYADALAIRKDYNEGEKDFLGPPKYWLSAGYRFTPGEVMELDYQNGWDDRPYISYERTTLGKKKRVQEPFKVGYISYYGHESYLLINSEVVKSHPFFKYSGYFDHWDTPPHRRGREGKYRHHSELISYLTAYALYPRQVEMLSKAKIWWPTYDLITNRKKNADVMKWDEPSPKKSFGMTAQQLRQFAEKKYSAKTLWIWNTVKRWCNRDWTLEEADDWGDYWTEKQHIEALRLCRTYGIDPKRLTRYLSGALPVPPSDGLDVYSDYLGAAYLNGLCMEHSRVLYPDDLMEAHEQQMATLGVNEAKSGDAHLAANLNERKKKYEFEYDGYRIIVPLTAGAVRREGKELCHCVGGYADRHVKGVLTILFLRRAETPNKPLVTIEMHGNKLQQIHGYKDDTVPCEDNPKMKSPKTIYKDFLAVWQEWLNKGSPRNEDGTPKISKKKAAKTEAA